MNKGLLLLVFICAAVAQTADKCADIEGYFQVSDVTGSAITEEVKTQLKGSISEFVVEGTTTNPCTTKSGDITLKNGDKIELTLVSTTVECKKQADKSLKCSDADATKFSITLTPFDTETNPNLIGTFNFKTVEIEDLKALKSKYAVDFEKKDTNADGVVVTSEMKGITGFTFEMYVNNKGEQHVTYKLEGKDAVTSKKCDIDETTKLISCPVPVTEGEQTVDKKIEFENCGCDISIVGMYKATDIKTEADFKVVNADTAYNMKQAADRCAVTDGTATLEVDATDNTKYSLVFKNEKGEDKLMCTRENDVFDCKKEGSTETDLKFTKFTPDTCDYATIEGKYKVESPKGQLEVAKENTEYDLKKPEDANDEVCRVENDDSSVVLERDIINSNKYTLTFTGEGDKKDEFECTLKENTFECKEPNVAENAKEMNFVKQTDGNGALSHGIAVATVAIIAAIAILF